MGLIKSPSYNAMNYSPKGIIDAACCGAFKRKSAEEANQLIEDLAKSKLVTSEIHPSRF